MSLAKLLYGKRILKDLAEILGIQDFEDWYFERLRNFGIAYWSIYERDADRVRDALVYANNEANLYLQQCLTYKEEAEVNDDYQLGGNENDCKTKNSVPKMHK